MPSNPGQADSRPTPTANQKGKNPTQNISYDSPGSIDPRGEGGTNLDPRGQQDSIGNLGNHKKY